MQTLVLNVPDDVYQDWKQQAESTNRRLEDAVVELMATSRLSPVTQNGISPELQKKLDAITVLDNTILKQMAAKRFPRRKSNRIQQLHFKRDGEDLSAEETAELKQLMTDYEEYFALRAETLGTLARRGQDVSQFIKPLK
jgi:hypothetical protein